MELIDIILPTYNGKKWLNKAVSSCLRQTYENFRLLIVDDGSTDGSIDTLPIHEKIKIFYKKHEGLVSALNFGIKQSKAKWIARMDDDDIMHINRLEKQMNLAQKLKADWISCQVKSFSYDKDNVGYPVYDHWHNSLLNQKDMVNSRFIECPMVHPTWLVKREIFHSEGFYKEGFFPEDYEFFLRNCKKYKIAKVNKILHYWRDHTNRVSRSKNNFSIEAFLSLKLSYFPFNKKYPIAIWGTSKTGKKIAKELNLKGFKIFAWVDIDKKKHGRKIYNIPIISPEEFNLHKNKLYSINCVMKRGQRAIVNDFFQSLKLQNGINYFHFQ